MHSVVDIDNIVDLFCCCVQVKHGEKSASMMTFWAGGTGGVMQKASLEKDKKRAQILERCGREGGVGYKLLCVLDWVGMCLFEVTNYMCTSSSKRHIYTYVCDDVEW